MQQKKSSTFHHPLLTSKTILLVGGGTGGHIFPLYPLAEKLLQEGHTVHLVVNDAELDRKVIEDKFIRLTSLPLGGTEGGLKVHYLKTHKIDYHLSLRNLVAPFKILVSLWRTKKLLKKIKPDVVFFKGGFVGFPVLMILKYKKLLKQLLPTTYHPPKVFLHDSDISAGKLTQMIGKNADHVFTNFGVNATPLFYWPSEFSQVRTSSSTQQDKSGLKAKPKILIFGGSQGAQFLNNLIVQNIEELTEKYDITLVSGPNQKLPNYQLPTTNYQLIDFMPQDELIQAMIQSDLVICRSGASMFQVLAAQTRCLAIPLPTSARNHQLHNAQYFAEKGLGYLLEQNKQTNERLISTIKEILSDEKLKQDLEKYEGLPQVETIVKRINTC